MSEPTYSVYFTGIWLNEARTDSRMDLLRRLFPHADPERLEHFLDHRRVLLIHGESIEEAKRLVMMLYEHGLECEIAEDAEVPPNVGAAVILPPPRPPAAGPTTGQPRNETPMAAADGADEFTPRGMKVLRAVIVVAVVVVLAATWAAWRRLDRGPAEAGADIPTVCATDTETTWYGRTRAQVLACVAKTRAGARYRLTLTCDRAGAIRTTLALRDATGAPRVPAWEGGSAGARRFIRYISGDASVQTTLLQRGAADHVGTLPELDAPTAARLLAAPSLDIADVFADEAIRFDLEAARWYIDYFTGACGLTQTGD